MDDAFDYRSEFIQARLMGPSALRIAEELCAAADVPPGARILDLGCGRGVSTMHLARRWPEATIFAADLWIDPEENLATFREAGIDDRVIPLRAEADKLPFAAGYFDAVVSIDCWQYFGGGADFLGKHIAPLLVDGGRLLAAVPGWKEGTGDDVPEVLSPWIKDDMFFRTGAWWAGLWSAEESMTLVSVRDMDCHAAAWEDWLGCDNDYARQDVAMMEADAGNWMATVSLEAVKG